MGFFPPGDVAGGCKLLRNRYESRDRDWATYTCVLGFHVYGEQGSKGVESCGRGGGGGTRWSLPWAWNAWRQGTGRSSPGRPLRPGALPGKDCLERGWWVTAANRAPETVKLWVAGGRGEEAGLRPAAVLGVWPDGSDGTDINSLCRSHNERVVAVADDFCKVHLFQYPCARAKVRPLGTWGVGWGGERLGGGSASSTTPPSPPTQAPSLVYGGHGSHVTSVRFTHDDSHLISLGGKDASIFQWRVLGAGGSGLAPATPSRTPSLSPASSLDV